MVFAAAVCVALTLIGAGRQGPAPSTAWTDRANHARASEKELEALLVELRPIVDAPQHSADAARAHAWSAMWLARARLDGAEDLDAIGKAVIEARKADVQFMNEDWRAGMEYDWARRLLVEGRRTAARDTLDGALGSLPNAVSMRPLMETLLAAVLLQQSAYDAAFAALARAESGLRADDEDHVGARGDLEGVRGEAWLALGLPDLAFGCFEICARIAEAEASEANGYGSLVQARLRQAALALATHDLERVGDLLGEDIERHARDLHDETHAQLVVRRGLACAALAREGARTPQAARDLLGAALADPAIPDLDALAAELALTDLALHGHEIEAAKAHVQECVRRMDLCRAKGDPPRLELALLEAHRSRLALLEREPPEKLTERASVLRSAIRNLLAAVHATPLRKGGIGFLYWGSQRYVVSTLIDLELAIDDGDAGRTRALEFLAEVQAAGTLARSVGAGPVTLEQLRRDVLGPAAGLLVYLPSTDSSCVFVIDRDSIEFIALHAGLVMKEPISSLSSLLSVPPVSSGSMLRRKDIQDATDRLADLLLPPLVQAKLQSWSSVIVVGPELLQNVPFECLPMSDGQPLGTARAISKMPSLPIAVWLAQRKGPARLPSALDIVLLTSPNARPEDLALAGAAQPLVIDPADQQRLVASFPVDRTRVLAGADARISALEEACSRTPRIVSLLTHGAQDVQRIRDGERPAGLIATFEPQTGGVLWCSDVERLHAAELVELWSCGAARGPSRLGDDTGAHLVGAFFTGGASTVVASRSNVARRPTIDLAAVFHDRLRSFGDTPAEAMRRARKALATDPATSDPYYWALFSVEGLADRPLFPAGTREQGATGPASSWMWVGLLVLLGAAAVLVRLRSRRSHSKSA